MSAADIVIFGKLINHLEKRFMMTDSPTPFMRVLIVGAGGQGRIVAEAFMAAGRSSPFTPIGFVDDRVDRHGSTVLGLPVLGTVVNLATITHDAIVVAIGDNTQRQTLSLALEAAGERIVSARHPFSSIASDVVLGPGCMISAGVVITPGARIGRGVLLNTSSCIDHETVVGDFAHVAVRAAIGANVVLGSRTMIGLGAAVMTGRRVGDDCIVGAGALVAKDLPDNVVAVGVPARISRVNR
jgi:sugar O-acyltransferase (sialic acid O-acetyltransferase NeuD family)